MVSPSILNLDEFRTPVSDEMPSGESLRYEGTYDKIQEARRADDGMDQGVWQHETKASDWDAVIDIGTAALTNKTKDLQIAAWMTEALIIRDGFPGLRDGLSLVCELLNDFWDSLHPEIEDEDLEYRGSSLEWMNQTTALLIKRIPVTQSNLGSDYSLLHWEEAQAVDNLGRQSEEAMEAAVADGKITGKQFNDAVAATPKDFYVNLGEDVQTCVEAYEQLEQVADERFGDQAPSLRQIKASIQACQVFVNAILKKKRETDPDFDEPEAETAEGEEPPGKGEARVNASRVTGPIRTREEAFRRLSEVAHYLQQVEPHSPVSYLVQRAVSWGNMSLTDLLKELIRNEDQRYEIYQLLGIGKSGEHSDDETYREEEEEEQEE
jgi:type VI secretion system protein ImpA